MSKLTIKIADALKIDLPDNSVNLVMTHPPYFGINFDRYGGTPEDQLNATERKRMLKLLAKFTKEVFRVLKDGGHFVIANGPIDAVDYRYFLNVIDKTKFMHASTVIQNSYSDKYVYNVTSEIITNNNIVTWYHFIKGQQAYGNPFKLKKYNNPVWNIPFSNIEDPVDLELAKKYYVGDVINKEVPKRFIEMLTQPGEIVLDPFGGSGIIPITAVELGRIGICSDISKDQVRAAEDRAILTFGESKYRKLVDKDD